MSAGLQLWRDSAEPDEPDALQLVIGSAALEGLFTEDVRCGQIQALTQRIRDVFAADAELLALLKAWYRAQTEDVAKQVRLVNGTPPTGADMDAAWAARDLCNVVHVDLYMGCDKRWRKEETHG